MVNPNRNNAAMDNNQDFFVYKPSGGMETAIEDDLLADLDEPPEHRSVQFRSQSKGDFLKATIRPTHDRKESLLTRALLFSPESETFKPEIHITTDLSRRRSTLSNTSAASTADLTSDGGLTSPARTNTPSPPLPATTLFTSFGPLQLGLKDRSPTTPILQDSQEHVPTQTSGDAIATAPLPPTVETLTKKRCITFACGQPKVAVVAAPKVEAAQKAPTETPKRACTIRFACQSKAMPAAPTSKPDPVRRQSSRSPSMARKSRPSLSTRTRSQQSLPSSRRSSMSPVAVRVKKLTLAEAGEKDLEASEATRFHEFAADKVREDDWIRRGSFTKKEKMTINDTLKKENAIRQLGKEAEEEAALDEDDEDDEEDNIDDSDDEGDHVEDDEDEEDDEGTVDVSSDEGSDGNESDNEEGFADSDDESDGGDFQFWTPGRSTMIKDPTSVERYSLSAHRTASESSIDSLKHMSPVAQAIKSHHKKTTASRRIRIRPGTPDLPDSTDFVCGTLDEDRPLEDAYVSCMEARRRNKHQAIPQDIDPSFPTSDPEDDVVVKRDSDEQEWIHGKFEESEEEPLAGRRKSTNRKSPIPSPKRMRSPAPKRHHSPPPAKTRATVLRSPPPRRLLGGHSPQRMRSPPPSRLSRSPAPSLTSRKTKVPVTFAPLGQRPGLTHTKSLPRTPNAFCQQYRSSRLAKLNVAMDDIDDFTDGHTRGAIDIVKGLERKRQRRKEKFYQKQCNRNRKGLDRKAHVVQPGKGAQRMRELGLQMAGKGEMGRAAKAQYVLSI